MSNQPTRGIYAGVWYLVVQKDGKNYIALGEAITLFTEKGADLTLLNDIGDKDPDEVMEALFASIPQNAEPTN